MGPTDEVSEVNKGAATLLLAATQMAMLLIQQRRQALQDAARTSQQAAAQVQKLQDAQLQAARPVFARVDQPDFWKQDTQTIAKTYETCKTWEHVDPEAATAVKTMDTALDERYPGWRDGKKPEQITPAQAQQAPDVTRVASEGPARLFDHGHAPYRHEEGGSQSYFVTVEQNGRKQDYWGVDLERALEKSGAKQGDPIAVERLGKTPVTLPDGTETHRNTWQITLVAAQSHDKERAQTQEQVQVDSAAVDKQGAPAQAQQGQAPAAAQAKTLHAPVDLRAAHQEWAQQQIAAGHDPDAVRAEVTAKNTFPHPATAAIGAATAALAATVDHVPTNEVAAQAAPELTR